VLARNHDAREHANFHSGLLVAVGITLRAGLIAGEDDELGGGGSVHASFGFSSFSGSALDGGGGSEISPTQFPGADRR
jgi:hypothetical protein